MTIQNHSKKNQNPPEHEHHMAKGTLYLMVAQVIFLGSGYIIHFGLARMVSPVDYGRFGVILAILMIIELFFKQGMVFSVSKFISEGRDTRTVKIKALKLQFILSLIFFSGLFLSAPLLANLLNDYELTNYIRFASFIIPIRALLALYFGVLNGFRDFRKCGDTWIINAIFRLIFVFAFLFLGFKIYGAIGGYIVGVSITLYYAFLFSRHEHDREGSEVTTREIAFFSFYLVGFSLSYVAIMNMDILFVKSLVANQNEVGYYNAARVISSVVFSVITGLSLTLFPSISESYSRGDREQVRNYINKSLRYLLMILLPLGIIGSLTSENLLGLFFPDEYAVASTALSILIFGIIFLSFFVALGSIITGIGKVKISMCIGGFLVGIDMFLNYFLVKNYEIVGGALATLFVGVIGTVIFSILVFSFFHALIPVRSFIKISAAIIPSLILGCYFEIAGLAFIPWAVFLFTIYIGILFLIKEINRGDLEIVRSFVK